MSMRALLRRLIGWDELGDRFFSADSARKMETVLCDEIERLRNEIQFLKSRQRANPPSPKIPDTWEEVMSSFMSDTEHFKEQS